MNYCQIAVIAETKQEMRSILSALINALDQKRLNPNMLEQRLEYETAINDKSGGKIIVVEVGFDDDDRTLTKQLNEMI